MKTLAIMLALLLTPQSGHTQGTYSRECSQWATANDAISDDARLHYFGCDDPWGVWERAEGKCNEAARRAYRKGIEGAEYNVYVGAFGCVLYEDGSWGDEGA